MSKRKQRPAKKAKAPKRKNLLRLRRPIRWALRDRLKPDVEASTFKHIKHVKKRRYLEALATTPRMAEAARLAGVSRVSAYLWTKNKEDVEFQEALEVAGKLGLQRAIDEGWKRGVDGWEEPVFQGGRLVGTKLVKSDTMLIFMLKGEMPEKYRERQEITGPGGGPIELLTRASLEVDIKITQLAVRLQQLGAPAEKPVIDVMPTLPALPEATKEAK